MKDNRYIPTLEDIISFRFNGMSVFTIGDMKSDYWHAPLDRPSQILTMFNTPFLPVLLQTLPIWYQL